MNTRTLAGDTARPAEGQPDSILVVEDDENLRTLLVEELCDAGYQAMGAADVPSAERTLQSHAPALVLSDLRLPGEDGMALFFRSREHPLPPAFIILTAFGTVQQAVDALKEGVDDFITKPLDLEHLRLTVGRTLELHRLRGELQRLRTVLYEEAGFHGLIGRSTVMQRLFTTIQQVARLDTPVLITGESGVGKELVAQAIHNESNRAATPMVTVNCAALPADLQESELFGHTAGAFTGAGKARKGLFQEADGGTLLLDEIGETTLELQAKLLRVLQEGEIRPVGADRALFVDTRVLAATNRDLVEAVQRGEFREDLYYRLEAFSIHVPPLRDRGDDLDLLLARLIHRSATRHQRQVKGCTAACWEVLRSYPFPGNVRELQNAIERAVAFCDGEYLRPDHLPERMQRQSTGRSDADASGMAPLSDKGTLWTLSELEAWYIRHVLEQVGGNKRRAADILGIGRRTLYRRLGETGES